MKRFWNGGFASPLPLPQAGLNVRRRLAFEDRDVALENLPAPSSSQPQCMMSRCHQILTPSLCRLGLITCIDARPNCPRRRPNRPRPNRLHRRPRPRPGSRPRPRPFPFPFPGEGIPGGGTADLERKFWFVWLTLFLLLNSSSTVIGEQNGLIVRLKVLLTMAALILSSQVPWELLVRTLATTMAEVGHAWATALAAPGSGAQAGAPPVYPHRRLGPQGLERKEGCEVAAMALKVWREGRLSSQGLLQCASALKVWREGRLSSQALLQCASALKIWREGRLSSQALLQCASALKVWREGRLSSQALLQCTSALKTWREGRLSSQALLQCASALKIWRDLERRKAVFTRIAALTFFVRVCPSRLYICL